MTKILLAYRPSAPADAALAFALDEARMREAHLVVLASEKGPDHRRGAGTVDPRPLVDRLDESGVEYELRTVPKRDDPADDILAVAEREDIAMVVLGVRKRTPVGKILMGSTAQRVLMEAPCPVVCVKPEGFVPPAW